MTVQIQFCRGLSIKGGELTEMFNIHVNQQYRNNFIDHFFKQYYDDTAESTYFCLQLAVAWNNRQAEPIQLSSCFTGVESLRDRRGDLMRFEMFDS